MAYLVQNSDAKIDQIIQVDRDQMALPPRERPAAYILRTTANLRTKIPDFRGLDSSRILIVRGGIPRPLDNFPELLSQRILVGTILVGRLGVYYDITRCQTISVSQRTVVTMYIMCAHGIVYCWHRPSACCSPLLPLLPLPRPYLWHPFWRVVSSTALTARERTLGYTHSRTRELFELILLLKLDRRLHVEQFEATASQSSVPSSPLNTKNYKEQ